MKSQGIIPKAAKIRPSHPPLLPMVAPPPRISALHTVSTCRSKTEAQMLVSLRLLTPFGFLRSRPQIFVVKSFGTRQSRTAYRRQEERRGDQNRRAKLFASTPPPSTVQQLRPLRSRCRIVPPLGTRITKHRNVVARVTWEFHNYVTKM